MIPTNFLWFVIGGLALLLVIVYREFLHARDTIETALQVADAANKNADDANIRREEIIKIIQEFSARPATVVMTPQTIQQLGMQIIEFMATSMNPPSTTVDFIPKKPSPGEIL